jgi:hypothetical protein
MAFGGGMRALSLESGVALVALDPRSAASPLAVQARLVRPEVFVVRGPSL